MAVELSEAKGTLKATAEELGITPQILTRWRRERVIAQGTPAGSRAQVSQEQQEIVRLKKELKQAELERDILKRRSASSPGATGNIWIYKGSPSPVSR
jgi:transposase